MERRFFDTSIWTIVSFRKLKPSLKTLYFYVWSKCDACGCYIVDFDYIKIDTGEKYVISDFEKLSEFSLKKISAGKFFFENFINVNYGTLKENYNPHKPALRALRKNNIDYNSSLNQACFKLEEEEEDVYEEEDEEENKKIKVSASKKFEPPEFSEFETYCKENGFGGIAKKAFEYYSVANWRDSKNNQVKNWKQKLQGVWFKDENKENGNTLKPLTGYDGLKFAREEAYRIAEESRTQSHSGGEGYSGIIHLSPD